MKLRLDRTENPAPGITTFVFGGDDLPAWQPGQFIKYTLPHDEPDDRGEWRFFTIASPPYENRINITTRVEAKHSSSFKRALMNLQPGDEIEASRPMGGFVFEPDRPAVLIAGGIGVTPYRAMFLQLAHDQADFQAALLYANRDNNYVFQSELDEVVSAHKDFTVTYVTEPSRITEQDILKAGEAFVAPLYYLSGPEPMVGHYETALKEAGVVDDDIKTDYFPGYNH